MKKKIFIVIAAMFVFGLAVVAFSYGTSNNISSTAASCCYCSGDSCPLKNKDASGKEAASCCDDCDCCKGDGASCPMMTKDAEGKTMKMDAASCPMMNKDAKGTAVKTDDAKECPMMKKDADGKLVKMDDAAMSGMHMEHHTKMDGKGCSCCHHSKEKERSAAPAV